AGCLRTEWSDRRGSVAEPAADRPANAVRGQLHSAWRSRGTRGGSGEAAHGQAGDRVTLDGEPVETALRTAGEEAAGPVELITAVRDDGTIYPIEKLEAHRRRVRHRAVSIFVRRGDRMLLQRRAATKYHSGGLW